MPFLSLERLDTLLPQFPRLRIGLLGDLFLDRYFEIDAELSEISIETQLEAHQVVRIRNSPGAMGTVMNNLAALGVGQLVPLTAIGSDGLAHDLLRSLESLPVDRLGILQSASRMTPTYLKPLRLSPDRDPVELSRLDVRSRVPLEDALRRQLVEVLERTFSSCDGWIVLDQVQEENCGVVNHAVRDALRRLHHQHPEKLVFIDSRQYLGRFDFGTLKGNQSEILEAARGLPAPRRGDFAAGVEQAAASLAMRSGQPVYCTLGEYGILCVVPAGDTEKDRQLDRRRIPGISVPGPVDIVGAGDSATSGIVTGLLCGATPDEAAGLGNLAASITVRQLGTTGSASPEQLRAALSLLN